MRFVLVALLALAACGGPDPVPCPQATDTWSAPREKWHPIGYECVHQNHRWRTVSPTLTEPGSDSTWQDLGCAG
ncbi:MAG TPA: hypothetical protein VFP65_09505 [Anaeromyxobacteraceae bacterium]|nr:hypothetical protein [Anaeromyxobacteraceae bacterium]